MNTISQRLARRLPSLHCAGLAYHGFPEHPLNQVMARAVALAGKVKLSAERLNLEVVIVGSMLHDIFYGLEPRHIIIREDDGTLRPARNKEEVASYLGGCVMEDLGASAEFIRAVQGVILATNPAGLIRTLEEKIVAAADLADVGLGSTATMMKQARQLYRESLGLNAGKAIPFRDYVYGSVRFLGRFTARRIVLTKDYFDELGRSRWHVGATANIAHLARQAFARFGGAPVIADLDLSSQPAACCGASPTFGRQTVSIVIRDREAERLRCTDQIDTHYAGLQAPPPMTVSLPMEGKRFSLNDGLLDRMYLPIADVPAFCLGWFVKPDELRRILRPGGSLCFYSQGSSVPDRSQAHDYQRIVSIFMQDAVGFEQEPAPVTSLPWEMRYARA